MFRVLAFSSLPKQAIGEIHCPVVHQWIASVTERRVLHDAWPAPGPVPELPRFLSEETVHFGEAKAQITTGQLCCAVDRVSVNDYPREGCTYAQSEISGST